MERRNFLKIVGSAIAAIVVNPLSVVKTLPSSTVLLPESPAPAALKTVGSSIQFGATNPLAVKRWAKALFEESQKQSLYFNQFRDKLITIEVVNEWFDDNEDLECIDETPY